MGRSKRTSDPLLCEQKELSIVANSFFNLHCALSNLNVNKYGCRSQFVYSFWFPEIWLDFYRRTNEISDFTQFLIYITIDRMVPSSTPSSEGRPQIKYVCIIL